MRCYMQTIHTTRYFANYEKNAMGTTCYLHLQDLHLHSDNMGDTRISSAGEKRSNDTLT